MASEDYELIYENGVISAPPQHIDYPQHGLGWFYANVCDKYADNVFQHCPYRKQSITFAQHKRQSLTLAANLQTHFRIQQGDVVMICMRNSLENTLPISATFYLAGITATLDPTLSVLDCAHLISIARPKLLIVDKDSVGLICASLKAANTSMGLVINEFEQESLDLPDMEKSVVTKCFTLHEMLHEDETTKLFQPASVTNLNIPAAIVFSSGTTGLPKGICISQRSLLQAAVSVIDLLDAPKVYVHLTTMYWISGLVLYCMQFQGGGTRISLRSFEPEFFSECVAAYKINSAFIGSAFAVGFEHVIKYANKYDMSSLTLVALGGTMLTVNKLKLLMDTYPNIFFANLYGMSETSGPTTGLQGSYRRRNADKMGSIGVPLPGVQIKVVDRETGKILGPNKDGEIRIKSTRDLLGYYNDEHTNPRDEEGFIKSGDVGYYDQDYTFYCTGRTKDMFKCKSWHIVPASIENILTAHPAVDEAVVFGIPSEEYEYLPGAVVVLRSNFLHTEAKEIADFVAAHVAERQRLIGGVYFIDKLPKTVTGKLNRTKLTETMLKRISN